MTEKKIGALERIGNWTNPAPQIRNPKSQIGLWLKPASVQFEVSDFGFEVQDSSNFQIPLEIWGLNSVEIWQ